MMMTSWKWRPRNSAGRFWLTESPYQICPPQLQQIRLCALKQHKAALVFYRKRGRTVSLFQKNASGINLYSLDHEVIDGRSIWRGSFDGYNLAAFEDRNVVYVLVSDLRESELLEMASA